MDISFKEFENDNTHEQENPIYTSLNCKHNADPRKIEEYALSNNLMSISRCGRIYENIVDYEILAHCLTFDALMSQGDCTATFTRREQEIVSSYYQNIPIHNADKYRSSFNKPYGSTTQENANFYHK